MIGGGSVPDLRRVRSLVGRGEGRAVGSRGRREWSAAGRVRGAERVRNIVGRRGGLVRRRGDALLEERLTTNEEESIRWRCQAAVPARNRNRRRRCRCDRERHWVSAGGRLACPAGSSPPYANPAAAARQQREKAERMATVKRLEERGQSTIEEDKKPASWAAGALGSSFRSSFSFIES